MIDEKDLTSLMAAIAAERLVLFCGAGLSMAPPTCLPSSATVADLCIAAHSSETGQHLPNNMNGRLDLVADHFANCGLLEKYFLKKIVPWPRLQSLNTNAGHRAVADFSLTRMAAATITTNYDTLIEDSARRYGADFLASLCGAEARTTIGYNPLLKLHGCLARDRDNTVWSESQLLTNATINQRILDTRTWLKELLHNKDIVFIGFWSDWGYLNEILEETLKGASFSSVFIVDPQSDQELEHKASALWSIATAPGIQFKHIQMSGADFLDDFRRRATMVFLAKQYDQAREHYLLDAPNGTIPVTNLSTISVEALYDLRRDAAFVPRTKPATLRDPSPGEIYSLCHFLLFAAGAHLDGAVYILGELRIRLINGAGRSISTLRALIDEEPPLSTPVDYIICAGAIEIGTPPNVVREGQGNSIIRPAASAVFYDYNAARERLGF